jgi:DNA-binding CsgD family transcriptional regulator
MVTSMPMPTVGLVERDAEIAHIEVLLDEASYGRGGMLVFEGEPGIGKTALVQAAVSSASAAGMPVLAARGSELERGFAFGVLRQALERIVAKRQELFAGRASLALSALGPSPRRAGHAATEGTLDGLYWLLAELSEAEPLLLAVDDAHWADEESVAFLRFLALRLAGMSAAVLVATRPPVAEDALAALLADPAVEVVRPRALGPEGAARYLARELDREPGPAFAAACHAATGGNPFLIAQVAQTLRAEGVESTAEQLPRIAELRPPGLARTVMARLDAEARALARAVAILGDEVSTGLAAELAGLEQATAERAGDALVAAGVLADRRPLRFRHELLRGAVLADRPAGELAAARAAAVELLREHGAEPERIAAQLLHLEPRGDAAAAALTLREAAAQASARGAPASAAALLRRALEEPLDADARVAVLIELGAAERSLGLPEAADRFIEAARIAPDHQGRLAAAVAAGHAAALDPARSAAALRLLDGIELPSGDRLLAVRVINARLAAAWSDVGRFHAVAAEAEPLAPIAAATPDERRLLAHLARARLEGGGDAAEVAALTERATDLEAVTDPGWFVTLIVALTATDRYDPAERLAQRAVERARERGALSAYLMAMAWWARIALLRGDLEEAEGLARAALEAGELLREWWRLIPAAVLIEALVDQGRVEGAAAAWTATGLGEAVPPQRPLTQLLHARGRLRLAQGDPAAALEDLREAARRLGPAAPGTVHGLTTRLATSEAQHAVGRDDEARHESLTAVKIARRFGAASCHGAALRVHGRVTGDEAAIREAVDTLDDAPTRLELARALVDLGAMVRRRGARSESRASLRAGHELALACHARGLADHARSELAASGVHVERGDLARRDELTPSERRIAKMAAEGASNKEIAQSLFLTVKTVEMHLSSAYRKLEIRSRRDLSAALASSAGEPAT